MRVLVLCHANRWRSPLAHVVLTMLRPDWHVDSAGLGERAAEAQRAARPVRDYAQEKGFDLDAHRSRQVKRSDILMSDLVLYMDSGNQRRLDTLMGSWRSGHRAKCLASYIGEARIPDPAFRRGAEQRAVFDLIMRAVGRLASVANVSM